MTIREATQSYLHSRDGEVAPSTLAFERGCMAAFLATDGDRQASRVSDTAINEYRRTRRGVRACTINQEVATLVRVLKHAGIAPPAIKKLRYRQPERVALTPEQKGCLLETAASRPSWRNAYGAAVLSSCTTMRAAEIRALRVRDVDLEKRVIIVPRSKTDAGQGRVIPINDTALAVLAPLCSAGPDVFVIRESRTPHSPVCSWRSAWAALTRAAGLHGLGFHALRHQAITEMAEAGVPDGTIKALAGHVSQRMLERYSHARVAAKTAAVGVLG